MIGTVSAFDLMLCCGVALWPMFSIAPCANIELPVLQSILDYKERIMNVHDLIYVQLQISLFRNEPVSQYSERELSCGQTLC